MIIDAIIAASLVAAASLVGALIFGGKISNTKSERILVPLAVGVFLSLVLFELIPETLLTSSEFGGIAVMFGFVSFYVLSNILHKRYHHLEADECDKRGAAALVLTGDAVHNFADGLILGGAFLIDPAVGVAVAIGLAIHEIPQEIIEFGVLLRAGYSKTEAAIRNFISASSIILGTIFIITIAEHADEYVWILTGFAAGNLLYLAAADLLPRIHGSLKEHGGMNQAAVAIVVGFAVMSSVIYFTHELFGHGHEHEADHNEEAASHETNAVNTQLAEEDHHREPGTPEEHTH